MTPHEREREARNQMAAWLRWDLVPEGLRLRDKALDAYRDAIEARVRWDQQADAEGYNR